MGDESTTLSQLKEIVKRYSEDRDWDQYHGPKELAIGVITEASELLEQFRFKSERQMAEMLADPKSREEIGDELVDVLVFLLRFSQMYGMDLSEAFERKMAKNVRKYPVEKARGKNIKYTEL
ncbi:MAG: nucleotide pyrophosphohydrolase [Candidatus Micrarchaeota archaeon]|nr:nucleotide pyrophosphohydrolase [Candidatus Micrarchaeota archaeon]